MLGHGGGSLPRAARELAHKKFMNFKKTTMSPAKFTGPARIAGRRSVAGRAFGQQSPNYVSAGVEGFPVLQTLASQQVSAQTRLGPRAWRSRPGAG